MEGSSARTCSFARCTEPKQGREDDEEKKIETRSSAIQLLLFLLLFSHDIRPSRGDDSHWTIFLFFTQWVALWTHGNFHDVAPVDSSLAQQER